MGGMNALLAISHWNMFNKSIFPREGPSLPRAPTSKLGLSVGTCDTSRHVTSLWPLLHSFLFLLLSNSLPLELHGDPQMPRSVRKELEGGDASSMLCTSTSLFSPTELYLFPWLQQGIGQQRQPGGSRLMGVKSKSYASSVANRCGHKQETVWSGDTGKIKVVCMAMDA